jgi:hypothetical protein
MLWRIFREMKLCTKFYVPSRKYLNIVELVFHHFMRYLSSEMFIHLDKVRFGVGCEKLFGLKYNNVNFKNGVTDDGSLEKVFMKNVCGGSRFRTNYSFFSFNYWIQW